MCSCKASTGGESPKPDGLSESAQQLLFARLFASQYDNIRCYSVRSLYYEWSKRGHLLDDRGDGRLPITEGICNVATYDYELSDPEAASEISEDGDGESDAESDSDSDCGSDNDDKGAEPKEKSRGNDSSTKVSSPPRDNRPEQGRGVSRTGRNRSRSLTAHMVLERNNKPKRRVQRSASFTCMNHGRTGLPSVVVIDSSVSRELGVPISIPISMNMDPPVSVPAIPLPVIYSKTVDASHIKSTNTSAPAQPHPLRKVQSIQDLSPPTDSTLSSKPNTSTSASARSSSLTSSDESDHSTTIVDEEELRNARSRRRNQSLTSSSPSPKPALAKKTSTSSSSHSKRTFASLRPGNHHARKTMKEIGHKLKDYIHRHRSVSS